MSRTQDRLEVRRATLDDVPSIAHVHVKTWRVAYRGQMPDAVLDAQSEERRANQWRPILLAKDHGVSVAVIEGAIVGFCDCIPSRDEDAAPDTGEIASIYVDPTYWRAGVGRALMAAGIDHARSAGHRALTLWVLASNAWARRFYENQGFSADGAEKLAPRGDHTLHELRYRRELGPAG